MLNKFFWLKTWFVGPNLTFMVISSLRKRCLNSISDFSNYTLFFCNIKHLKIYKSFQVACWHENFWYNTIIITQCVLLHLKKCKTNLFCIKTRFLCPYWIQTNRPLPKKNTKNSKFQILKIYTFLQSSCTFQKFRKFL